MSPRYSSIPYFLTLALILRVHAAQGNDAPLPIPALAVEHAPDRPAPVTVNIGAEQISAYRDYLAHAREKAGIPGLAVALVQPGKVLLLEGFGARLSMPDGVTIGAPPVTPDTRFMLGSSTTAFNSLLLARLAEQNIVDLDAPAHRYWDEFKLPQNSDTLAVSLRHLLNMTAGVPDHFDALLQRPTATPTDLFSLLAQLPDQAQPGDTFSYSDASAAAAGYLATYAANQRRAPAAGLRDAYIALAKTQLFDPLGMKSATYEPPSGNTTEDDAPGHLRQPNGVWQQVPPTNSGTALTPARDLRVSARDVAEWLQLEVSGGIAPDGTRLLSEQSVTERWLPERARDSKDYGMGWERQYYHGVELVARVSEQDGQTELLAIIPQYRTALAVLLNGGGQPSSDLLQDALLNITDLLREAATMKP